MLRELIQKRFQSYINVFTTEGIRIPDEQLKAEYQVIRQFLLDFHSDDVIAIKLKKDYLYLLCILACQEIGITYIPMKDDYPPGRILQIQEDSKFNLLMTDEKMSEVLRYKDARVPNLPFINEDMNAYIIFTSGSTGKPKGVIIQRKALSNFYQWIDSHLLNITPSDRLIQVTEFTFDISLLDVGIFLTKNVEVYFSGWNVNIFKLAYEIQENQISILNTVPNNLNMFLTNLVAERMNYKSLKHLFIAGSRFSFGLYQKCIKYFTEATEIYNLYGPTEGTVYTHWKKLSFDQTRDLHYENVSIGKPLPNMFSIIVNEGELVGPGEKGELLLGGIQLLKEYCNNPEQTKSATLHIGDKRFYKSGDLAFMNENGEYFIVGRNDDTIKLRGFRINLSDIDSYILRVPYVQDSVSVAIEDENTDNKLLGFVILKDPTKTVKDLKKDLHEILLDYQIPEKIFLLDKYPTNFSGKVDRNALKVTYLESLKKAKT
jgi:acyl-coenzyme A synthetase/AMP-(fatty) acid ligase